MILADGEPGLVNSSKEGITDGHVIKDDYYIHGKSFVDRWTIAASREIAQYIHSLPFLDPLGNLPSVKWFKQGFRDRSKETIQE